MVLIIKCLHMLLEAFISLHLHRSTITIWYAAAEFILQEYSSCTSSGKKMIKSPDATILTFLHYQDQAKTQQNTNYYILT